MIPLVVTDLVGKPYKLFDIPPPKIIGSCSGGLEHPNKLVKQFRDDLGIYCGDFELSIIIMPKESQPGASFEEFYANLMRIGRLNRYAQIDGDHFSFKDINPRHSYYSGDLGHFQTYLGSSTPAQMLWDCCNFGCLLFAITSLFPSLRTDKYDYYSDRFFTNINVDFSLDSLEDLRSKVLDGVRPLLNRYHVSRHQFEERIAPIFENLQEILVNYPTISDAVLPEAHETILNSFMENFDGNFKSYGCETPNHYFYFSCATS